MTVHKLGVLADKLERMKLKVEREEQKIKALKDEYNKAKLEALKELNKQGTDSVKGKIGQLVIARTMRVSITDPLQFYKYVSRNKAWDMLPKSVNSKAYRERLETGKKVPGVEHETVRTLRVNKVVKRGE